VPNTLGRPFFFTLPHFFLLSGVISHFFLLGDLRLTGRLPASEDRAMNRPVALITLISIAIP
jgi:hypothetical protein